MALHTGEAVERDGDYFGTPVNQSARLMTIAHGGQVLCSAITAALATGDVPLLDLGEHRLRDLSSAQRVFQVGEGRFPPLRSVDVVPTNLPTVRTELIGRAKETAGLTALVEHERLVTLTGVGGVGKTRLALAVAGQVAPRFPDGCWFVDLAPVSDGADVPAVMAAAMGVQGASSGSLPAYLAERSVLIVVDNCEHVVGDVAEIADAILAAAPEVHLLATSREPLGVDGEVVRRVDSLEVPGADAAPDEALAASAVRLFAERGAAHREGFRVDASNTAAVVDICRHLDGIPLAIELAAARLRAMPPVEILRRLDERFRFLSGGARRAHERHRTLLATVAWSHDLLSDAERVVFRRLATFPASFDLDAAEAVAEHAGLDVVDCAVRLVDRSLLGADGSGRYRMLETLRQYAADRLLDAGEAETIAERHARYYLELVRRVAPGLSDARNPEARATLAAELDNLRAAADWCALNARWEDLRAMCRDALLFVNASADADATAWYRQVIEHHRDLVGQDRVDALSELAYLLALDHTDFAAAAPLIERAAAVEGTRQSPWSLLAQTHLETWMGHFSESAATARRALDAADALGNEYAACVALTMMGAALGGLGDPAARQVSEDGARRAQRSANPELVAITAVGVGALDVLNTAEPDFAAALEAQVAFGPLEASENTAMWLEALRGLTLLGGGWPGAIDHLTEALRLADRLGAPHILDLSLRALAILFGGRGYVEQAAAIAAYADANYREHRFSMPGQVWLQQRLDSVLTTARRPDSQARPSSRRDIMGLVFVLAGREALHEP